jgi:hypothetical protein
MSQAKPYKRPGLGREAPIRNMATAYRRAEIPNRKKPRLGGPLMSTEDIVVQAVKLGYKIADDQILKGQDVARRLRGASTRSDSGDVGDLVDQGLRLAKQLAVLLVEMTETTTQAPSILRAVVKGANEERAPVATPQRPAAHSANNHEPLGYFVPVAVKSTRLTRVSLVLHQKPTQTPDVYPLYCAEDASAKPLLGVSFEALPGTPYVLKVDVPDDQMAGTYRGYAVNPGDGQPLGTIVIVVRDEA